MLIANNGSLGRSRREVITIERMDNVLGNLRPLIHGNIDVAIAAPSYRMTLGAARERLFLALCRA